MDLKYDYNDALNHFKLTQNDIDKLRNGLPDEIPSSITDKQLLLFYNACNFDYEHTWKVIKVFYESHKNTPEHFDNRDPTDSTIEQCLDNQSYFVIPPVEKYGHLIVYHKLMNPIASNYVFDNAVKTYIMSVELALSEYGPTKGIIFLHDMENVRFSHLFRAHLSTLRKFLHFVQYGLPAKVNSIHVFNCNSMFNRILALIRPFMKKELLDIIYTHPVDLDYEEFYKNVVPKSHLPKEYGGELSSIEELHSKFRSKYYDYRDYFITEQKHRHDCENNNSE